MTPCYLRCLYRGRIISPTRNSCIPSRWRGWIVKRILRFTPPVGLRPPCARPKSLPAPNLVFQASNRRKRLVLIRSRPTPTLTQGLEPLGKGWWRGVDSNHRRQCQQIYSLSPLATREPLHSKLRILYRPLRHVNSGDGQFTAIINSLSNLLKIWPHAAR
jgi:hypothetical protein